MTTETIYRKQIRPALLDGADVMDRIFTDGNRILSRSISHSETITGHPRRSQVACELVGVEFLQRPHQVVLPGNSGADQAVH